jgi:hypothetical protein
MEALVDGEKAFAAAKASGDSNFGHRIKQFIALQKQALGDIKAALTISQSMITDSNRAARMGYIFNADRVVATILVQMGDIPQAEGYMRRSIALIREARTSGLPGWRAGYNKVGRATSNPSARSSSRREVNSGKRRRLTQNRASGDCWQYPT